MPNTKRHKNFATWAGAVKDWNKHQAFRDELYGIPKKGSSFYDEVFELFYGKPVETPAPAAPTPMPAPAPKAVPAPPTKEAELKELPDSIKKYTEFLQRTADENSGTRIKGLNINLTKAEVKEIDELFRIAKEKSKTLRPEDAKEYEKEQIKIMDEFKSKVKRRYSKEDKEEEKLKKASDQYYFFIPSAYQRDYVKNGAKIANAKLLEQISKLPEESKFKSPEESKLPEKQSNSITTLTEDEERQINTSIMNSPLAKAKAKGFLFSLGTKKKPEEPKSTTPQPESKDPTERLQSFGLTEEDLRIRGLTYDQFEKISAKDYQYTGLGAKFSFLPNNQIKDGFNWLKNKYGKLYEETKARSKRLEESGDYSKANRKKIMRLEFDSEDARKEYFADLFFADSFLFERLNFNIVKPPAIRRSKQEFEKFMK